MKLICLNDLYIYKKYTLEPHIFKDFFEIQWLLNTYIC